jgi:hypothetical protein
MELNPAKTAKTIAKAVGRAATRANGFVSRHTNPVGYHIEHRVRLKDIHQTRTDYDIYVRQQNRQFEESMGRTAVGSRYEDERQATQTDTEES